MTTDASSAFSFFDLTVEITYHPFRVPPRCRKARQVPEVESLTIPIPQVRKEDAPIAGLIPSARFTSADDPAEDTELRVWNGQLLRAVHEQRWEDKSPVVAAGSRDFPASSTSETWESDLGAALKAVTDQYSQYVIIDGEVWQHAAEPVYIIRTYGLGQNHGGTGLHLDTRRNDLTASYISILEHDIAVEEAVKVAERRGDGKSLPSLRSTRPATILIPEAFTFPKRADRIAEAEAEVSATIVRAKDLLTGAVDRDSMRKAMEILDEACDLLFGHQLEAVSIG